jgi:hypothetical protein
MPELQEFWDPNEWEQHVYGLLQDRHGPLNVQKVPGWKTFAQSARARVDGQTGCHGTTVIIIVPGFGQKTVRVGNPCRAQWRSA